MNLTKKVWTKESLEINEVEPRRIVDLDLQDLNRYNRWRARNTPEEIVVTGKGKVLNQLRKRTMMMITSTPIFLLRRLGSVISWLKLNPVGGISMIVMRPIDNQHHKSWDQAGSMLARSILETTIPTNSENENINWP